MDSMIDYGDFAARLAGAMPRPDEHAVGFLDTAPRWELLRQFQEEWGYEVPADADEWRHEPVTSPELPIPAALDEWWALPYNSFVHSPRLYWTNPEYPPTPRPDPTGYGTPAGLPADSPLVPPGADRRVCVFKAEYEYCNEWGYAAADAGLPDPRVLVSDSEDGWLLQARSVSEFFLQLAVHRLPAHYGWTVHGDDDTERIVAWTKSELTPLGFLPWRELAQEITVYGAPDALVFHDAGYGDHELTVHARTVEALVRLGERMGVDWAERIEPPCAVTEGPRGLAFRAGDGRWEVVSVSAEPLLYQRPELESPVPHTSPLTALTHIDVPDEGPLVASGHEDGSLYLWMPESGDVPVEGDRRGPALTGLTSAHTADGPVLVASWCDAGVSLWDIDSAERADLDLGPGIVSVHLSADLRLLVGGPDGRAVLQLDADALWPARELMLSVVSFEETEPEVPLLLAELLSHDSKIAEQAFADLNQLLSPTPDLPPAAILSFIYLTQIGADIGVGAHPCTVRRRVLGLALRIAAAMRAEAAPEPWLTASRKLLSSLPRILPDMLREPNPLTRTAAALLTAALGTHPAPTDSHPEVAAAAALALGDATAIDVLVGAGWERADLETLLDG
ncbi:hypothetical protein ACFTT0_24865 [Streptomyces bauhiniae]|uniref:hypothetical protein n=1 Tax=Streptomyces bauhiniae TaxID=2340725 RepID=UPI00363681CC